MSEEIAVRPATSTVHAQEPDAQPSESFALPRIRARPMVSDAKRAESSFDWPGSSLSTSTVTPPDGAETQGAPWSPRRRTVTFESVESPAFFAVTVAENSSPTTTCGADVAHV